MRETLRLIRLCIRPGVSGLIISGLGMIIAGLLVGAGHGTDLPARMLAGPYGTGIAVCTLAASLGGLPDRWRKVTWYGAVLLAITHAILAYSVYATASSADIGYFKRTMQYTFAVAWLMLAWGTMIVSCFSGAFVSTRCAQSTHPK